MIPRYTQQIFLWDGKVKLKRTAHARVWGSSPENGDFIVYLTNPLIYKNKQPMFFTLFISCDFKEVNRLQALQISAKCAWKWVIFFKKKARITSFWRRSPQTSDLATHCKLQATLLQKGRLSRSELFPWNIVKNTSKRGKYCAFLTKELNCFSAWGFATAPSTHGSNKSC